MRRKLWPLLIAMALAGVSNGAKAADLAWDDCDGTDEDQSIAGCTKVLARGSREPTNRRAIAYLNRGQSYARKGDLDRAIPDFDRSVDLNRADPQARLQRGMAFEKKGDLPKALENYKAYLDRAPDNTVLVSGWVERIEDTLAAANRRGASGPAKASPTNQGPVAAPSAEVAGVSPPPSAVPSADDRTQCAAHDPDVSIAACTAVISDQSVGNSAGRGEAYANRGRAYTRKGEYDHAIADTNESLRIEPKQAKALYVRGFAYFLKGDNARAMADVNKAFEFGPETAELYNTRGVVYAGMGDLARAIADFDRAVRLDPAYARAYQNRGILYSDKGESARAIADMDKAIGLDPTDASLYNARGRFHEKNGDHDRAIMDFDRAIRLDATLAIAYRNRGIAYSGAQEFDLAIADLDRAIRLKPKNANFYVERARIYERNRDDDRAIADFDQAISLRPNLAIAHAGRGFAYLRKGDFERAIADYDQAIWLDPGDASLRKHRGLAFEEKGELAKARADLSRCLELDRKDADARTALERIDKKLATLATASPKSPAATARPPCGTTDQTTSGCITALDPRPAPPASSSPIPSQPRPTEVAKLPTAPVPALKLVTEKRVALVIGNGHYAVAGGLPNPIRDAAAVAEELRGDGFTVTTLDDADRSRMIAALRAFRAQADAADWAVVYYAGHGLEMGGKNYLVPTDARLDSDRDIDDEAVALARVESAIEGAHRLRLVILDACRNNPFLSRMIRTASLSRSVERGFARVEPHAGTLIVFSAKEGETADDGDGAHSPFTAALLTQMRKPGLEVRRLFDSVRDDVLDATKNRQMPFSYGSLSSRADFYFKSAGNAKP